MKYLLDSDVLSDFYEKLSPNHVKIAAKLASLEEVDEVCISVLTLYEFEYGCANASDDKKAIVRKRIEAAPEDFAVLPLEAAGARTYGELKKALTDARGLDKKASKLHNIDLMIATIAVTEGCTLVSGDAIYTDIQRFNASLSLQNWLSDDAEHSPEPQPTTSS